MEGNDGSGHYPNDYLWERLIPKRWQRPLSMTATITLTMAAAVIYGSGRWLRGISDLVSLVHFGRSGGRDHNAACFGTISWKARTLNDGSGHYPNDGSGHYQ